MAKSNKIKIPVSGNSLANDVLSMINKKYKEFPGAIGFLSDASMVNGWFKSGCDMLDLAVSNKPNCGAIPYGKIVEIFGPSGSSKSLLAVQMMADCQKKGGLCVLFDTENAVGMLEFFEAIGLNPNQALYVDQMRCLEDIYESIESIITTQMVSDPDKPILFVVDSVMGATTKMELESGYDKEGWATAKAIVNSKAMRKLPGLIANRPISIILINQVRDNMNAMVGSDKDKTSGGQAIGFTASVRLKTKVISRSAKNPTGETIEVTVVKNRYGPPRKKVTFDINYDSGIDNYGSWLNVMKDFGFLKSAGSYGFAYEYVDSETGEIKSVRFRDADFEELLNANPEIIPIIYNQIAEKYVMKYKNNPITDVKYDENGYE